jgi:pilus assembly protein CpaB
VILGTSSGSRSLRRARRAFSRHRRVFAAFLLAAAVVSGLAAAAPRQPHLATLVVAAHDLAAGRTLGASDLAFAQVPAAARPDGALGDPATLVGRSVASAVRRGEPITDVRLVGPGLLVGSRGVVAAPVRLADAATAALVRAGDLVDVLAASGSAAPDGSGSAGAESGATAAGTARIVAAGARVLAVPPLPDGQLAADGALVVLAVSPATATVLAGAAASERLSVVIRLPDDSTGTSR